jgi:hypothetical protein
MTGIISGCGNSGENADFCGIFCKSDKVDSGKAAAKQRNDNA